MPKAPDPNRIRNIALRIATQVQKRAASGTLNAAIFLSARLKETVSVPAPRKRVVNNAGDIRYVATTRAVRGAPPRKLSGKLRQSITYGLVGVTGQATKTTKRLGTAVVGVKARGANGFNYPAFLESHGHPFMSTTVRRYRADLVTIVGDKLRVRVP